MSSLLAAVEYGGPWELPPVNELFEWPAFWFEDTIFAFNRVALLTLLASFVAGALFLAAFNKPKIVPSKFQAACEAIVDFIRDQIALQAMGSDGLRFVPLLTTIFLFVWINNLFEIIPFINFPPTSRMAIPAFLTVMVYVLYHFYGVKAQGLGGYLKNTLFPPGAPVALYILLTPIEIIQAFVSRPLTLAVRLFANMLAGHIILTLIFITIHAFLVFGPGLPVGLGALAASPLLIGFELVVGLLQAYIFTILTAVYIGGSLHPEH